MRNLAEFLARFKHWFVFVLLEILSFVLLFKYNNYQGSVWFSSANDVAGWVFEMKSDVGAFFSLTKINKELTQRNLYLEHQVSQLQARVYDKTVGKDFIHKGQLAMLEGFRLIPAKVVDNSVNKPQNFVTIDKGSADGIRQDMGVACGNGVVGIVYLVSKHYSVVIPVLNTESNISCAIDGTGYFGYLHWKGGPSDIAYLDDVPRHAHFRLHGKIVTSGYSSVFPPGVMVGEILHVFNSDDGLSYRLMIKLSTDFGNLRDVCVIDDSSVKERLNLLKTAQDSIKEKVDGSGN
ncbi:MULTISPECIES: rod shape-determining protein MreC [Prevotella]|jgi:rod shape-determining protein MreC|uniref:Cell shape-determining protein MreC n=1 Tax=Prevotella lacticifex TaxID=2854755 RepID=A0A9R1CYX0_9BACT|nr:MULTISPECIES: rod shape-determining protein MreC [Prevotella]MDD6854342.1 rod shape-determining protein MreC [Prevotella sp.]MDY6267095.1 rod shape-determining protein MreC [Prevotella sp.]GJG36146.1 rod shape-determining protein MreC [Prevotella lacticifex]GJG38803.1 rod shape-determining protein MreC [Prevotella lacticifex]GJG42515.1 rod shape-determining protein MreC [Prevotella lacticifex]